MESTFIQPIYPQLRFGVELNKLYPEWYLHPSLKNLIYETRINTERRKEFTLEELFAQEDNVDYQKYQNEILYLKDRLTTGKSILGINASPGVHLWVLRNFLGLLPTPVFPKNTIRPNNWSNISIQCKDTLIMLKLKCGTSNHLEDIIAQELCELPSRNIVLILELFELFRCLGTKLFVKSEIDKRSAMAIVRYFTPCLFSRPFRPGIIMTYEKRLYALVLFIIFNWPTIKQKCQAILSTNLSEFDSSKLFYLPTIKEEGFEIKMLNKSINSEEEILNEIIDTNEELEVSRVESSRRSVEKGVTPRDFGTENKATGDHKIIPEDLLGPLDFNQTSNEAQKNDSSFTNEVYNNYRDSEVIYFVENYTQTSLENIVEDIGNVPDRSPIRLRKNDVSTSLVDLKNLPNTTWKDSSCDQQELNTSKIRAPSIELIKFDKETSNSKLVCQNSKNTQASTPKKVVRKVHSSKLTRLKKIYKKESQIIVLHINPCRCKRKSKKKSRNSSEEFEDAEEGPFFVEKNNFETPEKDKNQVHILDTPNFCCNYSKDLLYDSNFEHSKDVLGWRVPSSSIENNGVMYDSFGNFGNMGHLYSERSNYTDINLQASNPFYDLSSLPNPESLKERMAKIGWSYEEPSDPSSSPRSQKTDIKNQYKIYFNDSSRSQSDDESKKESNFVMNLKKFGSKLNVFKNIRPKLRKLSISAENLISDVKYKELVPRRSKSI